MARNRDLQCGSRFHTHSTGRLSGMGTVLPPWLYQGLRSIPMLVPSLSVGPYKIGGRPSWRPLTLCVPRLSRAAAHSDPD
jgi:hypothetical protein